MAFTPYQPKVLKGAGAPTAPQPKAPAPTMAPAPNRKNAYAGANDKWANALAQQDAGTQERYKQIQQQGSVAQRQASELNARMGRGVGGGFGSMMAQTQIGTQQAMSQAAGEAAKQKLDLSVQRAQVAEGRGAQDLQMQQERYMGGQGYAQNAALNEQQYGYNAAQAQADRDQRITELMAGGALTYEQAQAQYDHELGMFNADAGLRKDLQQNEIDSTETMQAVDWGNKFLAAGETRKYELFMTLINQGFSQEEALLMAEKDSI